MIDQDSLACLKTYWSYDSQLHGARHWAHVAYFGRKLATMSGLDESAFRCVNAFAWTHDLWRMHDGGGNQHGRDGFDRFQELDCDLVRQLNEPERQFVARCIRHHSDGYTARDACEQGLFDGIGLPDLWMIDTAGCCWDADRLDLSRLGRSPIARYMSTRYWMSLVDVATRMGYR